MMRVYPLAALISGTAAVPALPGVYVFRAVDQQALYVGKSKNLRARLASYVRPGAAKTRKGRWLRQFTSTVHIECTGSEFAALLREVELVQTLAPPCNQRLRHPERYAYVGIDYRDQFPRLTVTTQPWEGGQFLGPFVDSRRAAAAIEAVADAFHLRTCAGEITPAASGTACGRYHVRSCSAPCVGVTTPGQYGRDLLRAVLALTGRSRTALRVLVAERDRLAAAERFEDAARRQRRIAAIEGLRRLLFISQRAWHETLVVQPGAELGTIHLWGIAAGRVCRQVVCARGLLVEAFAAVWDGMQHAMRAEAGLITQQELDTRWIVHRWLRTPSGKRWSVPIGRDSRALVWQRVAGLADRTLASLFPGLQGGEKMSDAGVDTGARACV